VEIEAFEVRLAGPSRADPRGIRLVPEAQNTGPGPPPAGDAPLYGHAADARAVMRRPPQLGHKPRPLHENGTETCPERSRRVGSWNSPVPRSIRVGEAHHRKEVGKGQMSTEPHFAFAWNVLYLHVTSNELFIRRRRSSDRMKIIWTQRKTDQHR
jgi:hypothetical protein